LQSKLSKVKMKMIYQSPPVLMKIKLWSYPNPDYLVHGRFICYNLQLEALRL
jgi:hypothetical protein